MKNLFSVALLATIGMLSANSCNKPDPDPQGRYTCTCLVTATDTTLHTVKIDTIIINEDLMQKSLATTYCNNAQAANTDTFGHAARCTLH